MKNRLLKVIQKRKHDQGSTIVEMIVSFALLGIFMACSAALLSNITAIYYAVKGETYSREVADIMMEKMVAEIEGAEYFDEQNGLIEDNPRVASNHLSITLFDKTDTKITMSKKNNKLVLTYHEIKVMKDGVEDVNLGRAETDWFFDDSVYNGFYVTDLQFYMGGQNIEGISGTYGLNTSSLAEYGNNVILILLEMKSEKYGVYHFHRFVRMHNVPDTTT